MDVIKACDHIIDIGPEGGRAGGRVICTGTPREIAENRDSETGKFLKRELSEERIAVETHGRGSISE
jgi:excinuclease ABC subunit A